MKFKITIPEKEIKPEIVEKKNRALFSDNLDKGGILAKAFVFCYLNQPISVTELTKKLSKYDMIDYDRATVFRALKQLNEKYLLASCTSADVITLHDSERKPIHKEIMIKYYNFLEHIPKQFRKNFSTINYFWIHNNDGLNYIEWCCKLLNFKCEVEK